MKQISYILLAVFFCLTAGACSKNIPGEDTINTRTLNDTITNEDGVTITVDDEWQGTISVDY